MPRPPPDLPPDCDRTDAEDLLRQNDLELRLIPPLDIRAVLDGQKACVATRALLQAASNLIFGVLDGLPPSVRAEFIQCLRTELEISRRKPSGMSMKAWLEGPFQLGPPRARSH